MRRSSVAVTTSGPNIKMYIPRLIKLNNLKAKADRRPDAIGPAFATG